MTYVPIPKDLTRVKTKFALGLTKRQIVCFGGAAVIGIPLFFLLRGVIPSSAAAFLMVLVMLPGFLLAMYEKHGQPFEKVVGDIIQTLFLRPKLRPYQTDNLYAATGRQAKLYREVKAIVQETEAAPKG
ncbi:MAG: PrgI family protein [Klebsiella quasipneumoniae]|nr:PrgI family protein [Klebsiella quasipneumoniae]